MRTESVVPESDATVATHATVGTTDPRRCRGGGGRAGAPGRRGRGAWKSRSLAALVVGSVLLTAGCSGGDDTQTAAGSTPSATESTASPTPSRTPLYPTGPAGCHDNSGWSVKETRTWLLLHSARTDVEEIKAVTLSQSEPGYDGPLCEPIDVTVEYWKLTYGAPAEGDKPSDPAGNPDFYFSMERAQQTRLRHDGRKLQEVAAPKKLYADDRSVCVGALATVTVGKPLTEKELPETIQLRDGSLGEIDDVDFRTERVATNQLTRPEAAHVCGPDGTPTADPDDVPSPTAEPEPDPYAPTPLPTDFVEDLEDLFVPSPSFG